MATDIIAPDRLKIGAHELASRLIVGTGKYAGYDLMAESLGVGVRRLPAGPAAAATTATVELPAVPVLTVAARPTPALWLDKAETVYSPGVPVAATDDRVVVATTEPAAVRAEPTKPLLPPTFARTPAWPDADALIDLDGVYVG